MVAEAENRVRAASLVLAQVLVPSRVHWVPTLQISLISFRLLLILITNTGIPITIILITNTGSGRRPRDKRVSPRDRRSGGELKIIGWDDKNSISNDWALRQARQNTSKGHKS